MKNAIILHGLPEKDEYFDPKTLSASNSHWLPWIQKQLMVNGIKADTPEVPNAYEPDYKSFVKEVERYEINERTILIGHSMGAGFWVRYLCENPSIKVAKLILVAPWLNTRREVDTDFFEFNLRADFLSQARYSVTFRSDNDFKEVLESIEHLEGSLPGLKVREFKGYGHFTTDEMGTVELPELLEEAIS